MRRVAADGRDSVSTPATSATMEMAMAATMSCGALDAARFEPLSELLPNVANAEADRGAGLLPGPAGPPTDPPPAPPTPPMLGIDGTRGKPPSLTERRIMANQR
jgi:hypothetical protein